LIFVASLVELLAEKKIHNLIGEKTVDPRNI